MKPLPTRRRFTVDEYRRMVKAGVLHAEDRVELIDGEIIQMAPIGDPHAGCVNRTNRVFSAQAAPHALVSVQNPIQLSRHSAPQPDIALLRPRDDAYGTSTPGPADVLLVVEVADTTLSYDRRVKLVRYAEAGIPEAWIVNLRRRSIEVHREPRDGHYEQMAVYQSGATITLAMLPHVAIAVEAILG